MNEMIAMTSQLNRVLAALALGSLTAGALAADMSSTNYRIQWDTLDGGGGTAMSANYTVTDSIGQPTPAGVSMSASYTLAAGFQTPPDTDADSVKDFMDNCIEIMNANQLDTNSDGFGNVCDPDYNNDLTIDFLDLGIIKGAFFSSDPDIDLNGDNFVDFLDLGIVKSMFFGQPGPSGIAP